jgi:acyl carrier protein
MAEPAALQERIARLLLEKLHVEVPSREMNLVETGILDSLGFVALLVSLEEEFGVQVIPDDLDLSHFGSIERIARFVRDHEAPARGLPQ